MKSIISKSRYISSLLCMICIIVPLLSGCTTMAASSTYSSKLEDSAPDDSVSDDLVVKQAYENLLNGIGLIMETGVLAIEDLENQTIVADEIDKNSVDSTKLTKKMQERRPAYSDYLTEGQAEKHEQFDRAAIDSALDFVNDIVNDSVNDFINEVNNIAVDSGVIPYELVYTEQINETSMTMRVVTVSWITSIDFMDGGKYEVSLIMNQDDVEYYLVLEDDIWKISGNGESNKLFAPKDYDMVKGSFNTFAEALECAKNLDAEAENPF